MFDRVIVAFGDAPSRRQWREVTEMLRPSLWPGGQVLTCSDVHNLRQLRQGGHAGRDLVVMGRGLPADADDPAAAAGALGAAIDYVGEMQREDPPPACVMIGAVDNPVLAAAVAWPLFTPMIETQSNLSDMPGDLETRATALAARRDRMAHGATVGPMPAADPPWALLDIKINGEGSSCRLQIGQGNRGEEPEEHYFTLDAEQLRRVMSDSRMLRHKLKTTLSSKQRLQSYAGQWQVEYESLGRSIFELLGRSKFQTLWGKALHAAKGNIRLRFVLNEDAYDGLWEAMYDPYDRWMMLKSTIARQARTANQTDLRPLDNIDGKVHVLAIGSDVPTGSTAAGPNSIGWRTFWQGFHGPIAEAFYRQHNRDPQLNEVFPPLKEIEAELNVLIDLEEAVNRRRHEKMDLTILNGPKEGRTLLEQVEAYLLAGPRSNGAARCDVLHFAGHALFNEDGGPHDRGYLVFGGNPRTDFVPVSEFALWLKKAGVQMVYLSCCQSSAARAAFELANAGIPLAIGFTWDLDSALAVEFAKEFYGELFRNDLKICRAFQSARQALEARYKGDDPIWASPVLVAQPNDWSRVEGYMATV